MSSPRPAATTTNRVPPSRAKMASGARPRARSTLEERRERSRSALGRPSVTKMGANRRCLAAASRGLAHLAGASRMTAFRGSARATCGSRERSPAGRGGAAAASWKFRGRRAAGRRDARGAEISADRRASRRRRGRAWRRRGGVAWPAPLGLRPAVLPLKNRNWRRRVPRRTECKLVVRSSLSVGHAVVAATRQRWPSARGNDRRSAESEEDESAEERRRDAEDWTAPDRNGSSPEARAMGAHVGVSPARCLTLKAEFEMRELRSARAMQRRAELTV